MQQITMINERPLQVKEWQGQRVVTFRDIDSLHQRPDGTARKAFNRNKKHFIPDEDFFTVYADELAKPTVHKTDGSSGRISSAWFERPQGGYAEETHLMTESGYLMLVKSFKDDLAWVVQRALVNSYFKRKINPPAPTDFLERCGAIKLPEPKAEPDPVAITRQFLTLLSDAISRGDYYLKPKNSRAIVDVDRYLGYYDDDYISIRTDIARDIYLKLTGRPRVNGFSGKELWEILRATKVLVGSACPPLTIPGHPEHKTLHRRNLSREAINSVMNR